MSDLKEKAKEFIKNHADHIYPISIFRAVLLVTSVYFMMPAIIDILVSTSMKTPAEDSAWMIVVIGTSLVLIVTWITKAILVNVAVHNRTLNESLDDMRVFISSWTGISSRIFFKQLAYATIMVIPLLGVAIAFATYGQTWYVMILVALWIVILLLGIAFYSIKGQIELIMTITKHYDSSQATAETKVLLKKSLFVDLLSLNLQFILWHLLDIVTFGLTTIYTYPYKTITLVNFYNKRCK